MSSDLGANPLDNISVILVRTLYPGNIGSTARAMRNMGLCRLKLVQPQEEINLECRKMASFAFDLVEKARLYDSLDAASASENLLIATTSARGRDSSQRLWSPREIAPEVLKAATSQRVGLVFGSERSGLTTSELARCQYHVSVPARQDAPVLNLAQAVLVLAYELFLCQVKSESPARELATHAEREQMYAHLQEALTDVGFLSSSNPAPIMQTLRRVLGRAGLDSREVRILRGLMRQISWFAREGHRLGLDKVKRN